MRDLKLIVLVAAASIAVAACGTTAVNVNSSMAANNANANRTAATPGNANAALSATVAPETAKLDGKQIYADSCMICHKDTGKGGPATIDGKKIKAADLTSDRQKKHPDDEIAKDVSEGSPDDGMPAFKDKLKPEEIKAVVAYIRTLQGS